MSAAAPKIRIRDLRKAFGAKRVLRGVDLDVGVGESVAIIGGSGTGKSVMLKCLLGLIRPDGGRIEIDGIDVTAVGGAERSATAPASACCSREARCSTAFPFGRTWPSASWRAACRDPMRDPRPRAGLRWWASTGRSGR